MVINPLIMIPARLNSQRLPRKILTDIEGKPMIVRVYERCIASNIGSVVVACDSHEIAWEIEKIGGRAYLTDPELVCGSDRVYAAACAIDPDQHHDAIICVQGDQPTIEPACITQTLNMLKADSKVDIATLATLIHDADELQSPHVVKIALAGPESLLVRRALYFSRSVIPYNSAVHYHHIGLYAYRRASLERYMNLGPSTLEMTEKLEQLRALEDGMHIAVGLVDRAPIGVDTADDLKRARHYYQTLIAN